MSYRKREGKDRDYERENEISVKQIIFENGPTDLGVKQSTNFGLVKPNSQIVSPNKFRFKSKINKFDVGI